MVSTYGTAALISRFKPDIFFRIKGSGRNLNCRRIWKLNYVYIHLGSREKKRKECELNCQIYPEIEKQNKIVTHRCLSPMAA